MAYSRLFIFLEGDDDQRFFEVVFSPLFERRYSEVRSIQVSRMDKEKVAEWLRSVAGMGADYIFLADLDRHRCVTAAKKALRKIHRRVRPECIQIVKAEIESWYCAGAAGDLLPELAGLTETAEVTKERFESLLPGGKPDRAGVMAQILARYELQRASHRNASLRYFLRKYLGVES